jgi:hypothetical protein
MEETFSVRSVPGLYNEVHIDVALFSETHLKSHERFFIPNYHFCRTDRFLGRKGIPHNHRAMLHVRYVHLTEVKPGSGRGLISGITEVSVWSN